MNNFIPFTKNTPTIRFCTMFDGIVDEFDSVIRCHIDFCFFFNLIIIIVSNSYMNFNASCDFEVLCTSLSYFERSLRLNSL